MKRLVLKAIPDSTTRRAMLKRGEVDIAYSVGGPLGEEVRRTPGLTLRPTPFTSTHWLLFADQWDRIQQLMHDKVMMYLPIWPLAVLQGVGPRVAESGLGLLTEYPWSAPYEELRLKPR